MPFVTELFSGPSTTQLRFKMRTVKWHLLGGKLSPRKYSQLCSIVMLMAALANVIMQKKLKRGVIFVALRKAKDFEILKARIY